MIKLSSVARNAGLIILALVVLTLGYAFVQRVFIRPPVDARLEAQSEQAARDIVIQLRILNATNVQGIARQTTDFLRQRGFDVVVSDNAAATQEHSQVVCLRGDTLAAQQLAYALGIDKKQIYTELDSSLFLDCSVILGADYQMLRAFK